MWLLIQVNDFGLLKMRISNVNVRPTWRMFVVFAVLKGFWCRKLQGCIRSHSARSRRTRKSL